MLTQVDGSPHDWLEGRGKRLTLIASIDDATNEVPAAVFREQEDAAGYFMVMQEICQKHGLPMAVYADRHTIFQSPKKATIEQQLAGEEPRSQFGRLVDELGVELIPAHSPQAKGRVERLFGTLQDRLVKALRKAEAASLEEANQVLTEYLPRYNERFTRAAAEAGSAYGTWPNDRQLEEFFCFKYQRTVANDNTISFNGHKLQIPPGPNRISYARNRVDLHHYLDGRLAIYYQGERLVDFQPNQAGPPRVGKFTPAAQSEPSPPTSVELETEKSLKAPRARPKPAADHPWRRAPISAGATNRPG